MRRLFGSRAFPLGVVTCLMLILMASGCATEMIKVKPVDLASSDPSRAFEGVVFHLPKSVLVADITYSVYEKTTWRGDAHGRPIKLSAQGIPEQPASREPMVMVERPVQITIDTVPDPGMAFLLETGCLDSAGKDTEIVLELTDEGLLKSTNMATTDKIKEIATNLTHTAFNLAKLAAVTVKAKEAVELRKVQDVTVTRRIDPATLTCTRAGDHYVAVYSDQEMAAKSFPDGQVPDVRIELRSAGDLAAASRLTAYGIRQGNEPATEIRGIPYRVPGAVDVTVTVDQRPVYAGSHVFAQAAGIGLIAMSSRAFSSTTSGVTLSATTGGLTKYSSKSSASLVAATETAKEVSSIYAEGAKEMLTYGLSAELERVKKQQELAKAEADLDLVELEAKIERLKKEKELIDAELALEEAIDEKQEAAAE